MTKEMSVIILYITTGLRVLSARLVLLLTLGLCFALFCWAMWEPTWPRIACGTIFAVLTYWPAIKIDASTKHDRDVISPSQGGE